MPCHAMPCHARSHTPLENTKFGEIRYSLPELENLDLWQCTPFPESHSRPSNRVTCAPFPPIHGRITGHVAVHLANLLSPPTWTYC